MEKKFKIVRLKANGYSEEVIESGLNTLQAFYAINDAKAEFPNALLMLTIDNDSKW